jgi:hypothetical protein
MLHERMTAEEKLTSQIEELKFSLADSQHQASRLDQELHASTQEANAILARSKAAWEDERRALEANFEQVCSFAARAVLAASQV